MGVVHAETYDETVPFRAYFANNEVSFRKELALKCTRVSGQASTRTLLGGETIDVLVVPKGHVFYKGIHYDNSRLGDKYMWLAPLESTARQYARSYETNSAFAYHTTRDIVMLDVLSDRNAQVMRKLSDADQLTALEAALLCPESQTGSWEGPLPPISSSDLLGPPPRGVSPIGHVKAGPRGEPVSERLSDLRERSRYVHSGTPEDVTRCKNRAEFDDADPASCETWTDFAERELDRSSRQCGVETGANRHICRTSVSDDIKLATVLDDLFGHVCDGYVQNSTSQMQPEIALFDRTAVRVGEQLEGGSSFGGSAAWGSSVTGICLLTTFAVSVAALLRH
jgi:hypothetical protein